LVVYLSLEQIYDLHEIQIGHYGGGKSLRDSGALEAALARPAMTFAGEDLYPDIAAKTAAMMHSLVMNHPFVDGNKRVGAHAALLFLAANGYRIDLSAKELEEITLTVARGELDAESLAIWFRQRISRED
jgi:death-on-curing protein